MKLVLIAILLSLLLGSCRKESQTEKTRSSSGPDTTADSLDVGTSALSPSAQVAGENEAQADGALDHSALDKDEEDRSPDTLFKPSTVKGIGIFWESNPEIETIMQLIGDPQFVELREAHLGKWEPTEEMKESIQNAFRTVAAAQGVDPGNIGRGNPQLAPNINLQVKGSQDSLDRVVGFVLERRSDDYGDELMRILDDAVIQSVVDPDGGPITVTPKAP